MQVQIEGYGLFGRLISHSSNILIIAQNSTSIDNLAASLFIEETLRSLNKDVHIVFKGELPDGFNNYSERITSKIEPRKLIVSFNWHKNAVDRVSYKLEGDTFDFIINPKSHTIKKDDIQIKYRGFEADCVITLGLKSLMELEDSEREYLADKTIINIDVKKDNQLFGRLNFVNDNADSCCSLVAKLFEKIDISPPKPSVDHLLEGMRIATNNFKSVLDPSTFEAAAYCVKIKKGYGEKLETKESVAKPSIPKAWLSPKIYRSKQQAS